MTHGTGRKPVVSDQKRCRMASAFTPKQGRYLAYIYWYIKLHGRPPAEADLEGYFQTSPAAVHQMIVTLENKGLIERAPGQARSIALRIAPDEVPSLETGAPGPGTAGAPPAAFPNVAAWVADSGSWIEIGYEYNTDTFARALGEGGMVWSGGHRRMTLQEALQALDSGIAQQMEEWR